MKIKLCSNKKINNIKERIFIPWMLSQENHWYWYMHTRMFCFIHVVQLEYKQWLVMNLGI